MASIRQEILVDARPEHVWAAVRDVGEIHVRLVPGFVTDCRLDGDARIVTFANGLVLRELIVDVKTTTAASCGPRSVDSSPTTTLRCRCSPKVPTAPAWSGSPTCCPTT